MESHGLPVSRVQRRLSEGKGPKSRARGSSQKGVNCLIAIISLIEDYGAFGGVSKEDKVLEDC